MMVVTSPSCKIEVTDAIKTAAKAVQRNKGSTSIGMKEQ